MTVYYYLVTCFGSEIRSTLLCDLTAKPKASRQAEDLKDFSEEESEEDEESEWLGPEELLRENVEVEEKRKTLVRRINRFRKAERKLHKFSSEGNFFDDPAPDADAAASDDE